MIHTFTQKRPNEKETFSFDIVNLLGANEIIQSVSTSMTIKSGTDAGVAAMISGLPAFTGSVISQLVIDGIAGNYYYITFTVTTSVQTLEVVGVIPVTGV